MEGEFGWDANLGRLYAEDILVDDADWKDKWKAYFKPAKITEQLVVKPTWEEYKAAGDEKIIEIDPGMAFGTGTHETTSLCPVSYTHLDVYKRQGQGEPGTNGGPSGDLYVVLSVKPHQLFERRGQDLWLEIPITFDQAALGDEITVPTLEGKVSYKVPAGTQPNTVFRLKNKGIKSIRSSRKGDLYVRVILEVPTKLNGKQKKAIHNMAKEVNHDCYHKKSGFLDAMKEFFS